ncbi:hypothetical protein HZC33_01255 [Candidatus Wolfebacteria bacterium]|nr:hypothetical protein [Candidatus Wolfebacteria bacterium]
MESLQAFFAIFSEIWQLGNRFCRWAIAIIAFWPILIMASAFYGTSGIIAIVSMVPIVAIVLLTAVHAETYKKVEREENGQNVVRQVPNVNIWPLGFFAIAVYSEKVREAIKTLTGIAALELCLGIYFALVPVQNDRDLIPVVVLIVIAMIFIWISAEGKTRSHSLIFLAVVLKIITVIFFMGGRDEIRIDMPKTAFASAPSFWNTPLCANGKISIDIKEENTKEIQINFRNDCISEVKLPPNFKYILDPDKDVRIKFLDGSEYVDGPGKMAWQGLHKGFFKIRGVSESGILKISLESLQNS